MSAPTSAPTPEARPLPVGRTLDRGFALLGRERGPVLVPALLLYLVPMLAAVVLAVVGMLVIGDIDTVVEEVRESTFFGDSTLETRDVANLTDGQWVVVGVCAFVAVVLYLWFSVAGYVAMIRAAQRSLVGAEALPLRDALREAMREAPRLVGLSLVALVVFTVGVLVAGLVLLGVYALSTAAALLVGLGIALLAAYLLTRLLLFPVVAVIEERGLDSFARAWRLTGGRFWSMLGLGALLAVVVMAVNVVVTLVLEAAFGALNALDEAVGTWALIPYAGLTLVASVVFAAAYLAPLVVAHRTLTVGDEVDRVPLPDEAATHGGAADGALWSGEAAGGHAPGPDPVDGESWGGRPADDDASSSGR